jgi:5-amino-6-(5-phosphoribosylamino)uracil reductase
VPDRPHILLSDSMSIDGHIDGATGERLSLSNAADVERVDAVRASYDAILDVPKDLYGYQRPWRP